MATFKERIMFGLHRIKDLISGHNLDKTAHPNGFDHNITITTETEPTITLKQTSHAIGSGSTTMGTIGFTDKNNKWICFVDAECMSDYNALDIHVNNVGTPGDYFNTPTICSFRRNKDNTCSINLSNNRIDNVSVLNCTNHIVVRKDVEPALWLMSTSQTNGTENNGGGAILFKDKDSVCLSAIDTDTFATENQFNFHLASPTSTSTSTAIPSVMRLVHDKNGVKSLDLMNNNIRRAKVSTPTTSDDKWSIVNKDYVDTALAPINSSLPNKSDKNHTHTASSVGAIGFPNYNAAETRALNTSYTSTVAGWLLVVMTANNYSYDRSFFITIGSLTIDTHGNDNSRHYTDNNTVMLPIPANTTYNVATTGQQATIYFIPCV